MYVPPHFEEQRPEALHALITQHPLGALVTHGPHGLDANHIPFELNPGVGAHGSLRAHVARANPVWQEAKDGDEVLVIFRAAEGYISPNSYPSKHETHRQVPTWNYAVAHVHGRLHIRDDPAFVRGLVARLTRTHEARVQEPKPWRMTDSAPAFIDKLLTAIVGLEVEITRVVGKSKLGQNREARDRLGAADALAQRGEQALATAMRDAMGGPVTGRE